jgi:N-acetyl-gamma-glutamyl-phosphate reductase
MSGKIKAGIIGGAGYTGGELIRILLNHPNVDLAFVHSKSNEGNYLHHVHQDLVGDTNLKFTGKIGEADVLFLCVGHGEARKFLENNSIDTSVSIIDLSQDFRLEDSSSFGDRHFIYGLPELNRDNIRKAKNIANPGCFATAIQLGLLPLQKMVC